MSTVTSNYRIPRRVARKVSYLRLLVRLYVFLEGVAALALVAGIAFWLALSIDWFFEPSPAVRIAMWVAVAGATGWVLWKSLLARFVRRLPAESLALLIERQHPELADSLVSTVQAKRKPPANEIERRMVEHTGTQANVAVQKISLSSVFRLRPLVSKALVGTLLVSSIVAFAFLQRESFGFWVERMQLSTAPWPRKVQLAAPGFDDTKLRKVARGDSFELEVHASLVAPHTAPSYVEIRYNLADGRRGRDRMTQVGRALPGRDQKQVFRYRFENVAESLEFDVVGGDARLDDLRLQTVARPAVEDLSLACEYPAYLDLSPVSFVVSGRQEVPEGTQVVCHAKVTKPLTAVRAYDALSQTTLPVVISSQDAQVFSIDLATVDEDRTIQLTFTDSDGVQNREPYRLNITAVADELPEVSVQLRGVSTAVTPEARIPLTGVISDDHGLSEVWAELQVDEQSPQQRKVSQRPAGVRKVATLDALDLAITDPNTTERLLKLSPGQKLGVTVSARDAYNLDDEPRVTTCPRFSLDVVTESELRALLERRELGLRQRFESIHEKMVGTRDLLNRIEQDVASSETSATTNTKEEPNRESSDTETTAKRNRERSRLRIIGARQNTTQLAYETLGVAEGFEGIVIELANNRIDTVDLRERLEDGIAGPLEKIANELMPQLEIELGELRTAYENAPNNVGAELLTAQTRADETIDAMNRVLDRMLELESYNELVELLRAIVKEQEAIREQTQQQRKNKLRGLLED